ncbi:MAG: hypothetical protein NZ930_06800 [Candidatus Bipolaricaulota bacterium]|nr:hypothetical protein [Candidatus Bipolaricaulota bacterium]
MECLKRRVFTIYFSPGHRSLAEDKLSVLEQAWRIAREQLAIDLGRFGVALVVPKEGEDLGGIILTRKIWALWDPIWPIMTSPGVQSLQQEADRDALIAIYWGMAHEAIEMKVAKKLYHDRAARWVGDGLAEYMGYTITSELAPHVRNEMLAIRRRNIQIGLIDQGQSHYDLTKEFLVKMKLRKGKDTEASRQQPSGAISDPGYAVSLAFWLQIAQKHGEGVIKEFWQRLSQRRFPNAKEAARILSELTGEDIWTKLQNMDPREALQTLERAAGTP